MLEYKINFKELCKLIPNWKWGELKFGIEKKIISDTDIISYANWILSENIEQFSKVLELSIADEDKVKGLLLELATNEGYQNFKEINSKWIFSIIYYAYVYLKDKVYDVIEDAYIEFEYPEEITCLISYMPNDDRRPMDTKLCEYISINKDIWC